MRESLLAGMKAATQGKLDSLKLDALKIINLLISKASTRRARRLQAMSMSVDYGVDIPDSLAAEAAALTTTLNNNKDAFNKGMQTAYIAAEKKRTGKDVTLTVAAQEAKSVTTTAAPTPAPPTPTPPTPVSPTPSPPTPPTPMPPTPTGGGGGSASPAPAPEEEESNTGMIIGIIIGVIGGVGLLGFLFYMYKKKKAAE